MTTSPGSATGARLAERLRETRRRTLALVAPIDDVRLQRQHDPLMSPLVWDLAHIAAYADLWLSRVEGAPSPLRPEVFALYDAFEQPRAVRGHLPLLNPGQARAYLEATLERACETSLAADLSADAPRLQADGFLWDLLIEHEEQHRETMLQALALAPAGWIAPERAPLPARSGTAEGMAEIPGGLVEIGARAGFAYDNEAPAHEVELAPFRLDRGPVTVGAWRAFMADGGYARRTLWTDAGWAWRSEHNVLRPLFWTEDDTATRRFDEIDVRRDDEPLVHVSAHEADAFARWRGARLPTEAEWEHAAALHPTQDPVLGGTTFGPAPVGPGDGADVRGLVGDVWEWTSTEFAGYPGFAPFPYPEYSEVFFAGGYRVLRGGSWATAPCVARRTFRNWDRPERRQIFAGLRCAESDR
ncbi:MAG: ergothioneine biosynthesis protein EgtB [Solirubrobacteraceae bacterium]